MAIFLDIEQRAEIFRRLGTLQKDDPPVFGKMAAQQMVEHLNLLVMMSNGQRPEQLHYPTEKAEKIKAYTIHSDNEIMIGFRAPMLPPDPLPAEQDGLKESIGQLKHSLEQFDKFFRDNPTATPVNPTMGPLTYREWITFHNKHFTHHFKQFNLL